MKQKRIPFTNFQMVMHRQRHEQMKKALKDQLRKSKTNFFTLGEKKIEILLSVSWILPGCLCEIRMVQ